MIIFPSYSGSNFFSGYIASTQSVAVVIPAGSVSGSATISLADTSYTCLFWNGFTTSNTTTAGREILPRIQITNATTVTAYRNTSSATHGITVYACVVEFLPTIVKSIQQGIINLGVLAYSPTDPDGSDGALIQTAVINAVDVDKTVVLYQGLTATATGFSSYSNNAALTLYSSTKVKAERGTIGSSGLAIGFMAVEFQPDYINSLTNYSVLLQNYETTLDVPISSSKQERSLLVFDGIIAAGNHWPSTLVRAEQTSDIEVKLTKTGTTYGARLVFTVAEFAIGVIANHQQGTTAISTSSPVDTSITPSTSDKSILSYCGQTTAGSVANDIFIGINHHNISTVRAQKHGLTGSGEISWSITQSS